MRLWPQAWGAVRAAWRECFPLQGHDVARWFPGHMAKGLKKMQSSLKLVDCVIEVHDARISFHAKIVHHLEGKGLKNVIFTNCVKDENIKQNLEYCIMVVGVPNVGKSSLINSLRRQHLRTGTVLDHLVGEETMADYLLYTLNRHGLFRYVQHYGLTSACDHIEWVLKNVAVKLGKTRKVKVLTGTGDVNVIQPDYPMAARDFLRTFRSGLLGQGKQTGMARHILLGSSGEWRASCLSGSGAVPARVEDWETGMGKRVDSIHKLQ
ncbi:hypothetical protein A6R68_12739 [Neotoma lepida]|uniref:G domain-containing protein n=1 Tax=Neotoma lepida TaxID=56216 RepID=A0A1A6H2R9_NEOLE|nr:hypothetical protein A6R68_12739 [Neotoma lepida]